MKVEISATVNAPVAKVWEYWNAPEHITKWNSPHESWHSPRAENDLRVGGRFMARMEAKDGSMGFDFGGVYDEVTPNKLIAYTMDDKRAVRVEFIDNGDSTTINESFDPEDQNPVDFQKQGWQAILDHFKRYTEEN
jgi:uncharacterized protein YndB with AHSA1/START domain